MGDACRQSDLCDFLSGILRLLEEDHEEDCHNYCISSESVPCCAPVRLSGVIDEVVYDCLSAEGSDGGSDTVGHEHEETLCAVLHLCACSHVGVERS